MRRHIAATLAVVLLPLGACDPIDSRPQPAPGERFLRLQVWVSEKCSPYTLDLESTGKGLIPEPEIYVAAGAWEHTLTYRSGARIGFVIAVTAKRGCAAGWCKIDDGQFGGTQESLDQYGRAICRYTTKG